MRRSASVPKKYEHIDFVPPEGVANAAARGLELRAKASPSNRGGLTPAEASKQGIGSGVQRATNLKNRDTVSPKVIKQMRGFLSRSEKSSTISPENKGTPWNDKGYVAWLLWGGDPAKAWVAKVIKQMEAADEKEKQKKARRLAKRVEAASTPGFPSTFDESILPKLSSDLRRLTKIYRSVPTEFTWDPVEGVSKPDDPDWKRKWEEARRIFGTYRKNLEAWVYGTVIPHVSSQSRLDTPLQSLVRSKAWSVIIDMSSLFPTEWNYKTDSFDESPSRLKRNRETNIRRYQKAFREFTEDLKGMIQAEGGTVSRPEPFEHFTLGGVNILIETAGLSPDNYEDYLRDLSRQFALIRKAGFGNALRGLTVVLRQGAGDLVAGRYYPSKDELVIYGLGQSSGKSQETTIHEIGHRFYFRDMGQRARKHWEEVMESREAEVEKEDVLKFDALVGDLLDEGYRRRELKKMIEARASRSQLDPEVLAKFRYLSDHLPAYRREGKSRREVALDHHLKNNVGEKVSIEHITDYGAKNPFEAFAEAFQLYVRKGPRSLGPWTRSFFERLTEQGKRASREARLDVTDVPVPEGGIKVLPQNRWAIIAWDEISDSMRDSVWDVYNFAYGAIGKHVPNIETFARKYKVLFLIDVDEDLPPDAFIAYKSTPVGFKIALGGTDGTRKAKKAMILKMKELIRKPGWYAEASHKVADILESAGVRPIDDEEVVRKTLKGKEIEWLGDGKYSRQLGKSGISAAKSLYGTPRVAMQVRVARRVMAAGLAVERRASDNEPTNPGLWAKVQALTKGEKASITVNGKKIVGPNDGKGFTVFPCVPVDGSEALTRQGWRSYEELHVGDEIVTYNKDSDCLEWGVIRHLHHHKEAPVIRLHKAATCFDFVCTADHKWVINQSPRTGSVYKTRARKYPDQLVSADQITQNMKVITSAVMADSDPVPLCGFRKHSWSWVERVLAMSHEQREAWLASAIVYDGHEIGYSERYDRCSYGFSQKDPDHAEATAICAVLLGYNVSFRKKKHNPSMMSYTFIDRRTHSTGNVVKEDAGVADVWCPQTDNQTWVMRQGRMVTITGNSAYANGWASKTYKDLGGGWKKKASTGDASEHVGVFAPLPADLAKQFPKKDEDSSKAHVTLCYIGPVPDKQDQKVLVEAVRDLYADVVGPIKARLSGVDYFRSATGSVAYTKVVFSKDMGSLKDRLKSLLEDHGIEITDDHPLAFNPHVTLAYYDDPHAVWDGPVPKGSWTFNEVEVWGLPNIHRLPVGGSGYPTRRASLTEAWGPTLREARGKSKKDVGHGGLDEWFSGHGGAKGKGEDATWGDWVSISPVTKTLPSGKKVEKGDIVGECGISDNADWKEITKGGEDPLKCMPRQKAHDMPKKERAEKAKAKQKAEKADSSRGKKPTMTPTFDKKMGKKASGIDRVFRSPKPFTGFRPVSGQEVGFKPRGLWYSCGSEWDDWCRYEMPHWITGSPYVYRIEVNLSRMLVIRDDDDFRAFESSYLVRGRGMAVIDWKAVARDYDGIEICPYQNQRRMSSDWYYGWDVASGCIWGSGAFKSVEAVDSCGVEKSATVQRLQMKREAAARLRSEWRGDRG